MKIQMQHRADENGSLKAFRLFSPQKNSRKILQVSQGSKVKPKILLLIVSALSKQPFVIFHSHQSKFTLKCMLQCLQPLPLQNT